MKLLLIGESCVDEYVYGHCERICPEAPAICFKSTNNVRSNLGMAGNVLANIKSLRPDYSVDIITNVEQSIIKRRFIDTRYNSIVFRQDINDSCSQININQHNYSGYNAIIFSDYCKGFLSESDISFIMKRIDHKNCFTFIDTKKQITDFIMGFTILKINWKEYQENIKDLSKTRSICHNIVVTKGEHGAIHIDSSHETHYKTSKTEVRDVCGAGDTFLASLAIRYLETKNMSESIRYANECSLKVVSKFGVTTP